MKITNKTQVQINLDRLETRVEKAVMALQLVANCLNSAYESVWSLPDDQLAELCQTLLNEGRFEEVFTVHLKAATYVNELLTDSGVAGIRAKEGAGKPYIITPEGQFIVNPPPPIESPDPEEEIVIDPPDEPEEDMVEDPPSEPEEDE
jgi:hypothetical protein